MTLGSVLCTKMKEDTGHLTIRLINSVRRPPKDRASIQGSDLDPLALLITTLTANWKRRRSGSS